MAPHDMLTPQFYTLLTLKCTGAGFTKWTSSANPLQPLTDGDPTCDPSLDGASEHRASPRCEHADMGGGDDSIGKGAGCPSTFVKDVICGLSGPASL